ncbi:MAG: exo-alpha-sialidase [Phycisphaerae bacterium]|nr:exo-alpha-sialidase [Phycisphaerae bacterium]
MRDDDRPYFASERLPSAGAPYNHAATIVARPDGGWIVAWTAGSRELADDTRIVASFLGPGTADDWTPPAVIVDRPGRADANPVLFCDARGRLNLLHVAVFGSTFCQSFVEQRVSVDHGRHWSGSRRALPAICTLVRNRPIRLRDGRWLLPAYVEAVYASCFYVSADDGDTWRRLSDSLLTLPHNNLQPGVVQRRDGSLYALMRSAAGAGFTWEGTSADGVRWSLAPCDELPNPGSGLDLLRLSTGEFVAAFNSSRTERTPLTVSISRDEGRRWSPPRAIAAGPGPLAYPSLAEGRDGRIHCVYSDRLEAIGHAVFNLAWLERPGAAAGF